MLADYYSFHFQLTCLMVYRTIVFWDVFVDFWKENGHSLLEIILDEEVDSTYEKVLDGVKTVQGV